MQLYRDNNERKKIILSADYRKDKMVKLRMPDGSFKAFPVDLVREVEKQIKEEKMNGTT